MLYKSVCDWMKRHDIMSFVKQRDIYQMCVGNMMNHIWNREHKMGTTAYTAILCYIGGKKWITSEEL